MPPTHHQQALQAHVAAFAKRHGYEADPVTVADLGDETFGLLETKSAVYLFSLPHDGTLVDCMSLYGESAVLVFLALAKLLNNGRHLLKVRGLVPQEHRHWFYEMTPRRPESEIPPEVLRITTAVERSKQLDALRNEPFVAPRLEVDGVRSSLEGEVA